MTSFHRQAIGDLLVSPTWSIFFEILVIVLANISPRVLDHRIDSSFFQSLLFAVLACSLEPCSDRSSYEGRTVRHVRYALNRSSQSSLVAVPRRYSVGGSVTNRTACMFSRRTLAVPFQEAGVVTLFHAVALWRQRGGHGFFADDSRIPT